MEMTTTLRRTYESALGFLLVDRRLTSRVVVCHDETMTLDDLLCEDRPLYRDRRTERLADGERVKEFQAFEKQAKKRLTILLSARHLGDLVLLPSNRLESLSGDRTGQFSIRIDRQWRICFEWPEGASGPSEIEIVDYH